MSALNSSVKKAFTLTELLVSLTVLGLIATLTLPHLFASFDRAKKRAVFKEAYQAISEAAHATMLEGGGNRMLITKLNGAKVCLNHAFREGCTTNAAEGVEMGVKLASGVSLFSLDSDTYDPRWGWADGAFIGLEDFPQKEYFQIAINMQETSFNTRQWVNDRLFPYGRVDTIVRPGEVKCVHQSCLDMLKND